MTKAFLGFALGLVSGIALTGLVMRRAGHEIPSATATVIPAATPTAPRRAPPPQSPAADVTPEDPACSDEVAALRSQVSTLTATVASLGGAPSPWPSSAPAPTRRDSLEKWLPGALSASRVPGTLLVLDCDEYPCIALIELDDGVPASSEAVQPVRSAFVEDSKGEGQVAINVLGTSTRNYATLVFAASDDSNLGAGTRTAVRSQALFDANSP
jgi:hypothetical protein